MKWRIKLEKLYVVRGCGRCCAPVVQRITRWTADEGVRATRVVARLQRCFALRNLATTMKRRLTMRYVIACALLAACVHAQDDKESLGPKQGKAAAGEHPISALMRSATWQLRPELRGKHPRVYVTEGEIGELRQRARTSHRDLWQPVLAHLRALQGPPPPPPAEERRAQNTVAIAMAEAAFAYAIEKDPKYLAAAKQCMDAAVSYDVWGYSYNKPNVDLAAGHLLYGLGWAYDLLYNDLTEAERARYRAKLVKQGELLYHYYEPKRGTTYSYSQNHLFIPTAGLAVAAYALQGEAPEAESWARLARALFDRVLATYSPDGYYYEGFEYWIFSTPWIIHYLDAQAHATGEDLYERAAGLRKAHLYVAHTQLPGGKMPFDFGDVFFGPLTRTGKDDDLERTHPGGHFNTNFNLLYRLAQRFRDPEAQGVAAWLKSLGQVNAEDFWSLIWYEPKLGAQPIEKLPRWHYFPDHEVAYWRTDWSAKATAIAFKCGPPEGHHTTELSQRFADWHLEAGHAHPDANSFIVFAHGQYLTGDSGYAGVPSTDQHNTLLVDGRGQANEGDGHNAWYKFPYEQLDKLRVTMNAADKAVTFVGEGAAAYAEALGLLRFERTLTFTAPERLTVSDEISAAQPHVFTMLLHADENAKVNGQHVEIARTPVQVTQPAQAKVEVEPNWMTGPGRPGSVASGKREARGERVRIATPQATKTAEFEIRMEIRPK